MEAFFNARIRNFPRAAKLMVVGYLLALGLAYLYALFNIFLVIGLSPRDIAIHYYGSDKKIEQKVATEGEQGLDLDALDSSPEQQEPTRPQPSLKNLVAEGHFHLFGMTSFFFGLTLLGLFTSLREPFKSFFVSFPYITIIVDNLSFMATRFMGPKFAFLTATAGGLMGLTFTVLWIAILFETLSSSEAKK